MSEILASEVVKMVSTETPVDTTTDTTTDTVTKLETKSTTKAVTTPAFDITKIDPREYMKRQLTGAICKLPLWNTMDKTKQETIIRRLERSIHIKTVQECEKDFVERQWTNPIFAARYSSEGYRIIANLDPESSVGSDYLGNALINESIDPKNVCDLPSSELCPEVSQQDRDELSVRMQQKIDDKYTTRYPCPRCGERKAIAKEVQTRAADELSSMNLKCMECEFSWIKG